MIKFAVVAVIILLAWAFLAEPVAQAGRATAKYFKGIWNND